MPRAEFQLPKNLSSLKLQCLQRDVSVPQEQYVLRQRTLCSAELQEII